MKLIIGLGNPGEKFLNTRHNLGFEVIEELGHRLQATGSWEHSEKFKSDILKISSNLILVKPTTYMNLSGLSTAALKNFYKVSPEDIIVIHDDLDLLLGHLKIRLGGGAGGHHGVESVIDKLGTDSFIRVRLGIGTEKSFSGEHKRLSFNAEKFVVETFEPSEISLKKRVIKKAIQGLNTLLEKGLEKAQNQFN